MPAAEPRTLYVLRHAKSDWGDPAIADVDRPLAQRGRRAAGQLAEHLRETRLVPDLVVCSPARRARETLAAIRPVLGPDVEVRRETSLYGAGAEGLRALLALLPPALPSVLLIGHNPGLHDLVLELAAPGPERANVEAKLPTCALVTLAFAAPWAALAPGCAAITGVWTPPRG